MARKPSAWGAHRAFVAALGSSKSLYDAVAPLCDRKSKGTRALHASQARRVIALSFLAMVAAWEEYLEAAFVRYLTGAAAVTGYKPRLRAGPATDIGHAYELLTGKANYRPDAEVLSWSSPAKVIDRAEIFFYQGQPFKGAIMKWQAQLQDANAIRNRVAHASAKCRTEFKKAALRLLGRPKSGQLSQGYSVGDLLVATGGRGFQVNTWTYFQNYWVMYFELLITLTPVPAPPNPSLQRTGQKAPRR